MKRLGVATLLALAACSAHRDADRNITEGYARAESLEAAAPGAIAHSPVTFTNKLFLGGHATRTTHGQPLPAALQQLLNPANGQAPRYAVAPGLPTYVPSDTAPYSRLLERVAALFDADWSYDGTSIHFDLTVTKIFALNLGPGTNTVSSTVTGATTSTGGGASSTGGQSSNTNQNTTTLINLDTWTEIEQTLAKIVPRTGAYAVNRSTGLVTIMAPPSAMRRAEIYLDKLNDILNTRIAIQAYVLNVDVDDTNDFGFDLTALFQSKRGLNAALAGVAPAITTVAGAASIGVVNPPPGSTASSFNGSQAVLEAVAQTQRLVDARGSTIVAQNNVPTPIQLTTLQDIVSNVALTTPTLGATQTTAATTTLNFGFALQVLPRVSQAGKIDLLISFTNSTLKALNNFSPGAETTIQLPTITQQALRNDVQLASGETLLIAGNDQYSTTTNDTGEGEPQFWFLGGRQQHEIHRSRLLLVLSASVMPPPGASFPATKAP